MENKQRAIVFANGSSDPNNRILDEIGESDILIAANGGTQYVLTMGLLPHVVVGDLDSISPEVLDELKEKDVLIKSYPSRKDETDLELALLYAKELGIKEIIIHNALGERWDMTVANLLLPSALEFQDMDIRIRDGQQEIYLLRAGVTHIISGKVGDTVSLIPIGGRVEGITSYGLEYPLNNDSLDTGSPRAVSNLLLRDRANIFLKSGLLLCIHIKQI